MVPLSYGAEYSGSTNAAKSATYGNGGLTPRFRWEISCTYSGTASDTLGHVLEALPIVAVLASLVALVVAGAVAVRSIPSQLHRSVNTATHTAQSAMATTEASLARIEALAGEVRGMLDAARDEREAAEKKRRSAAQAARRAEGAAMQQNAQPQTPDDERNYYRRMIYGGGSN